MAPTQSHHHSTTQTTQTTNTTTRLSTLPSAIKPRQLSHLHSQLAQLQAHMADLENLLRMTAVQAEHVRVLGGYSGGLFMAASKVLGEETVGGQAQNGQGQSQGQKEGQEKRES
ncbi:MAG: hypothetical protein M1830_008795 [Pleopsidium flavum]|nr:MAG: hypothetical protein M1830_008795 [Pleopsidium flavum]